MNRGSRIVALAAAYAVALHALLSGLAGLVLPGPTRGRELAVLCSAGGVLGSEERHAPAKPQPLCPVGGACTMPACVPGALGPDALTVIRPAASSLSAGYRPQGRRASSSPSNRDSFARGPPAA